MFLITIIAVVIAIILGKSGPMEAHLRSKLKCVGEGKKKEEEEKGKKREISNKQWANWKDLQEGT